ncbi:MAG: hypothetical protein O2894_10110 [Planctomycetota bacterium]|nr:hypothetical protein [Planctomycetota bacterium]
MASLAHLSDLVNLASLQLDMSVYMGDTIKSANRVAQKELEEHVWQLIQRSAFSPPTRVVLEDAFSADTADAAALRAEAKRLLVDAKRLFAEAEKALLRATALLEQAANQSK